MKAWLLKDQKGIGSMKIGDAFEPHAVAGEAVVELMYAALNPADRYLAEGMYPARLTLPHILGRDGVGKVIDVGPGIAGAKIGDAVMILSVDDPVPESIQAEIRRIPGMADVLTVTL